MKKIVKRVASPTALMALMALSAIAGTAQAQSSVTIYGVVDAGLVFVNNQKTPSGGTGSVTALNTGGVTPSIFGFKGSEDLGGGLKANFNLEGHFFAGTGQGGQWGGLFGRQSNVGLSNSYGTITLGKQYSPAVLAYAATDPRGLKETFSGLISWALTQSPLNVGTATAPANSNSPIDVFVANALALSTKIADVNLSGSYSFGENAGSNAANRVIALGAVYTGPVTLSASYQSENGQKFGLIGGTGVQTRKYSVGAGYVIGDATLTVNYLNNKNSDPASGSELAQYRVYGAGVNYRTSVANTATLAYYYSSNKVGVSDNSKTIILSDDYALSKRTTLYGLVAGVKASSGYTAGSAFGVANNNLYLASGGKTITAVELGIKHAF
ncbi:porin [Glaciimonas sp. Gout2]|uniref:porin n=1 Tax=unclassified Glaciimonas TaxID=2644401 RepID=UPI002B224BBB|nr:MULTISPECIES: porin [unclassified Glaciimonas]MEB0011632.1 porin [Glaciimonas sp. Cout2]MEB0081429.1 porin [Glaciimonas sp. Gout2]